MSCSGEDLQNLSLVDALYVELAKVSDGWFHNFINCQVPRKNLKFLTKSRHSVSNE